MSGRSPYKTKRLAFEANVTKHENGCWLWNGAVVNGYPVFTHRPSGLVKVSATRLSWSLYKGKKLKSHEWALHKCDTPRCVNPEHLFKGDHVSNMLDMVAKGRFLKGEKNPGVKLTAEKVVAIRVDNRSRSVIAGQYGIAANTVGMIKRKERWAHV